jgi:hypothetical protein
MMSGIAALPDVPLGKRDAAELRGGELVPIWESLASASRARCLIIGSTTSDCDRLDNGYAKEQHIEASE